jgi:hypothetical protein
MVKLSIVDPDPILGRCPAPPPPTTLVDGEDEYEVEAILDSQMRYNCLEYLVKWKGYDKSHNQWEEHMQLHAKLKIAQFHRKNPSTARHINAALFDSISFTRADMATSWRSSRVMMLRLCKGTSVLFLTSPIISPLSPCSYVFTLLTSVLFLRAITIANDF